MSLSASAFEQECRIEGFESLLDQYVSSNLQQKLLQLKKVDVVPSSINFNLNVEPLAQSNGLTRRYWSYAEFITVKGTKLVTELPRDGVRVRGFVENPKYDQEGNLISGRCIASTSDMGLYIMNKKTDIVVEAIQLSDLFLYQIH